MRSYVLCFAYTKYMKELWFERGVLPTAPPQLTSGSRAAQLQLHPPPFDILCSCGILVKEYLLVSILGYYSIVFWCCLCQPVFLVQSYISACCSDVLCFVLACFAGAGAILALYVASPFGFLFNPAGLMLVLICWSCMPALYCWLVAPGFWCYICLASALRESDPLGFVWGLPHCWLQFLALFSWEIHCVP